MATWPLSGFHRRIPIPGKADREQAFWGGDQFAPAEARVVSMSTVVDRHPGLVEIATLPPGWSASRTAAGQSWTLQEDEPLQDDRRPTAS
ncbi:hypothetical protein [Sphingomonas montana]|uniref:hypothetical protein n=1 Tax=Sphingomonas montana TaxID=1843236 RepID=UPI00101AE542|nr:hypothetical protein [Sphingomonas montana]